MIGSSLWALLMAAVGLATLFPQSCGLTRPTAITVSTITVATDPEDRMTTAAGALSQNRLAMIRHPESRRGLDNGDRSWQGRTIPIAMAA